jgi:hypothetical protein
VFAQLQVYFEYVHEFVPNQPIERSRDVSLEDLFDLGANLSLITLGVLGPRGRYAIQLILRVLERDIRIESRARGRHHISRNILQLRIGVLLPPHIEEVGLDIGAFLDWLNHRLGFSVSGLMLHSGRELPGVLLRETLEEDHREIGRLRLRRTWIVLNELLYFFCVSLAPVLHVLAVRRIGIDPGCRDGVVSIRPLRNYMRLTAETILLEPRFDVGRH